MARSKSTGFFCFKVVQYQIKTVIHESLKNSGEAAERIDTLDLRGIYGFSGRLKECLTAPQGMNNQNDSQSFNRPPRMWTDYYQQQPAADLFTKHSLIC